ncbi:MAG: UDP-N-acetylmuramoyl-L-alanine--D-glutamate ligase [Patescibacteria group bacterium]
MLQKQIFKKLNQQKIAILGLGLENRALIELLEAKKINTTLTICDARPRALLKLPVTTYLKLSYQLGAGFNYNLDKFDILFRSPGWPIACPGIQQALNNKKTELSSPLNLFFQLSPSQNIIGVTGTKGKGTTASLIYKILKEAKQRVWLGGNIGVAPLSFLLKIKKTDYIILELSSFQLEDLKYSPRLAIITNLFKEHLAAADPNNPNFHSSINNYWRAKLNIARFPGNRYLLINQTLRTRITKDNLANKTKKIIYFGARALKTQLNGHYNQENIGAAVALAQLLKIKKSTYEKTIANFQNLEHRLELVAEKSGVRYYDNSFSTTPESSRLDLESFTEPIILIGGGADKGANFYPFAQTIKKKVKLLILLPGAGTIRLKKALEKNAYPKHKYYEAPDMLTAVTRAKRAAVSGDVVLLSTACASFGLFQNYKERGLLFQKYVKK